MDDIVERLRELEPSMTVGKECKEAADLIERLRAEVSDLKGAIGAMRTAALVDDWHTFDAEYDAAMKE